MSRLRLNQDLRNKIASRWRVHAEAEHTNEKEKFFQLRESFLAKQNATWDLAKQCVTKQYPKDDVKMAHYLQDKYPNVNTIAKDSCFHFHYMGMAESRDYDNNLKMEEQQIEKHFDFRLSGSTDVENNSSHQSSSEYGYALLRDEIKAQEGCNPDILIEQDGKDQNPHLTKYKDANDKYLGNDDKGYGKEWNDKYQLDLIGREYCRDRSIACTEQEFKILVAWKSAKGQFIMAHYKWIKSVLDQMKEIKMGLKGYRYLDEAIELCTELGLNVQEDEVIRTNSTGLVIYNPKNLAERIKGMKNRNVSREDKIKARILYEQNKAIN